MKKKTVDTGQSLTDSELTEAVLAVLTDLYTQLHPEQPLEYPLTLDASLDHTLGIDSLGRAELIQRLERAFKVQISDELMVNAQTGHDLANALKDAKPTALVSPKTPSSRSSLSLNSPLKSGLPPEIGTLNDALLWHAQTYPDLVHIHVHEDDAPPLPYYLRDVSAAGSLCSQRFNRTGCRAR